LLRCQQRADAGKRRRAGILVSFVVDPPSIPSWSRRANKTSLAQASQVIADVVGSLVESRRDLANAMRPVPQDRQNRSSVAVGQEDGDGQWRPNVRRSKREAEIRQ
jgi:hypothetical protein